jgi:hypothetical protein
MIQLFRRMALKQEEIDLRQIVEKNKLAMFESAQRSQASRGEPATSVPPSSPASNPIPTRSTSAPAAASVPFDTLPKSARAPEANPTFAEALAKTAPEVVTANYH